MIRLIEEVVSEINSKALGAIKFCMTITTNNVYWSCGACEIDKKACQYVSKSNVMPNVTSYLPGDFF